MKWNASDAKSRFGEMMEQARKETVVVSKSGRPAVAIIDIAEYQRLRRIEDEYWGTLADRAKESGFLGTDATMQKLLTAVAGEEEA